MQRRSSSRKSDLGKSYDWRIMSRASFGILPPSELGWLAAAARHCILPHLTQWHKHCIVPLLWTLFLLCCCPVPILLNVAFTPVSLLVFQFRFFSAVNTLHLGTEFNILTHPTHRPATQTIQNRCNKLVNCTSSSWIDAFNNSAEFTVLHFAVQLTLYWQNSFPICEMQRILTKRSLRTDAAQKLYGQ